MSTIDLFQYIQHLEANGQTSQRYEIEFWRKVFYPLSCLVMVVLALPFAYLHFRSGGITSYVFGGVLIGISFFLLNNVFGYIGNLQNWWPWLTAAAPGLIYTCCRWRLRLAGAAAVAMDAPGSRPVRHGSRDPLWRRRWTRWRAHPRQPPARRCAARSWSCSSPTSAQRAASLAHAGAKDISIVPMFLGTGRHAREDLPVLSMHCARSGRISPSRCAAPSAKTIGCSISSRKLPSSKSAPRSAAQTAEA
jgi:hypothetical protein